MPVNDADIMSQVGAAAGLWTHTPVDYAADLGFTKATTHPADASNGYRGIGTGTRPGGAGTQTGPTGVVIISNVNISALGTTTASVQFTLSAAPTSSAVNYGTTQALGSTQAGTATSGQQTVNLTGLTTKTTYWYQVQAINASGTALSVPLKVKTS